MPQSFSITGVSPSNGLMSYPGHSLMGGGSYPSVEMQSVYSTAPDDKAPGHSWGLGGGSYPSVEMQSVYSTAPDDWADLLFWKLTNTI